MASHSRAPCVFAFLRKPLAFPAILRLKHVSLHGLFFLFGLLLTAPVDTQEVSSLQRAKDRLRVQTLLRLEQFDLLQKPDLKAAVLRHADTLKGTDEYLELVGKFQLQEAEDELARLMIDKYDASQGVEAVSAFG